MLTIHSLVTPGQVSPHLHQIVGGVRLTSLGSNKISGITDGRCFLPFYPRMRKTTSMLTRDDHLPLTYFVDIRFNISMDPNTDIAKTSTCTTCRFKEDKSNYWTAVLFFKHSNGSYIRVPQIANGGTGKSNGGMTVYYVQPSSGVKFTSFRKGFRMIVGDPMVRSDRHITANSVQSYALTFRCWDGVAGSDGSWAPGVGPFESVGFPKKKCPGGIRTNIFFPTCWDGKTLDPPDHHSHVQYINGTPNPRAGIFYQDGTCPSTHPVRLPLIFLETVWDTKPFMNIWPTDGSQPLVYSMGDPTGFGQHGDYVFGWEDDSLDRAMARCNDRGDFPADCKELTVLTDDQINSCTQKAQVNEVTEGVYLPALPGCNPIQNGPDAATMISGCTAISTTGTEQPTLSSTHPSPSTPTSTPVPNSTVPGPVATKYSQCGGNGKAVQQLLFDVDWTLNGSPLDVLVIDMPPGTGDVPLTLGQLVVVDGCVIVSTPQDVALSDVRKGVAMLKKVNVPITGLVLNQSYYLCNDCETPKPQYLFGKPDSFRAAAERLQTPILGELPLVQGVSTSSDGGYPYVLAGNDSNGKSGKQWKDAMAGVAEQVLSTVGLR
ncbi:hypothetical protein D9611_007777 [Ephemerocybe angulata]|uniref:DUF1996 domain-containing protein n=1 Tax=Ephemerocybe angulata TaxID=980116 RepID=A0A8H5CGB8_9AGAR|nr:hypothetical protein D9611_007777 [Tulosesus angulatus]